MEFLNAIIGLFMVVMVLAVFIPLVQELLPTMIGDMGSTTGLMVSTTVVVIIASAIFVFMRQSTADGQHADMQRSV